MRGGVHGAAAVRGGRGEPAGRVPGHPHLGARPGPQVLRVLRGRALHKRNPEAAATLHRASWPKGWQLCTSCEPGLRGVCSARAQPRSALLAPVDIRASQRRKCCNMRLQTPSKSWDANPCRHAAELKAAGATYLTTNNTEAGTALGSDLLLRLGIARRNQLQPLVRALRRQMDSRSAQNPLFHLVRITLLVLLSAPQPVHPWACCVYIGGTTRRPAPPCTRDAAAAAGSETTLSSWPPTP